MERITWSLGIYSVVIEIFRWDTINHVQRNTAKASLTSHRNNAIQRETKMLNKIVNEWRNNNIIILEIIVSLVSFVHDEYNFKQRKSSENLSSSWHVLQKIF